MVKLLPTTEFEIPKIRNWTSKDYWHKDQNHPEWWLTGNGLLSFTVFDKRGPCFYVRIDEGEYARLSVQFAPESEVSKRRVAIAIRDTLPMVIKVAKKSGSKGLEFDSESPLLICFMNKLGFFMEGEKFKMLFGD